MKRYLFIIFISLFLIPPALSYGETTPNKTSKVEIAQSEVAGTKGAKSEERIWKVGLGLRSTYFQMQHNRGEIFGNITLLDEEQKFIPYKPVVQVNFSKYLAVELSYDQFKAAALNRAFDIYPEHDRRWTDGFVEWTPLMLAFQLRWPHFHKSVVPYVLWGVSYTKTSWKRNDWYYYGFPSLEVYNNWTGQGNKPEDYPNDGYRRIFATEDHCVGALWGIGVDYFFLKNWALNLDVRYHLAKVDFSYTLAFDDGRAVVGRDGGTFVLDSWILGLGIKYYF
ncbi:MAG: hypothetical protein A2Y79_12825 [Deltaproteobacteria bacterium RBG_13_43_22]|nr:MAG: hypothetical protein A2Y79_12825 [Deltaproteobacteria bacterium RBG_13_43_22]